MKKRIFIFIAAVCAILVLCSICYILIRTNNNKKEYFCIIEKEKDHIEYATNIYRIGRENSEYLPYIGKDDFFLSFSIYGCRKLEDEAQYESYMLHVIPEKGGGYRTKLWSEDDIYLYKPLFSFRVHNDGKLGATILKYYFAHKSEIDDEMKAREAKEREKLLIFERLYI